MHRALFFFFMVGAALLLATPARAVSEPADPVQRICTMEYRPVCAQSGKVRRTFSNACMAAGARILHQGPCRKRQGG